MIILIFFELTIVPFTFRLNEVISFFYYLRRKKALDRFQCGFFLCFFEVYTFPYVIIGY